MIFHYSFQGAPNYDFDVPPIPTASGINRLQPSPALKRGQKSALTRLELTTFRELESSTFAGFDDFETKVIVKVPHFSRVVRVLCRALRLVQYAARV